ncbi:MAG: hypothetical protein QNL14_12345 [Deltaproteobacteria bacterium]|nr:hypothetical protein [Deltaproteobacteria bacterium]
MTRNNSKENMCNCPIGTFFRDVEKTFGKKSNFIDHMTQSRIEVLKAFRSLVDDRINDLDRKKSASGKKKKRMTKVEVD